MSTINRESIFPINSLWIKTVKQVNFVNFVLLIQNKCAHDQNKDYRRPVQVLTCVWACTGKMAKKSGRCPYMPVKCDDLYGHVQGPLKNNERKKYDA